MFFKFINPGLLRPNGVYFGIVQKLATSTSFGNPGMPDKLYKNIIIEMRGCEPAVIKSYVSFIKSAAEHLNITVEKVERKPKPNHHRITLLKSVFVHGKHWVQYEVRTHYTWVFLKHLTGSTADTFLEYIERMLPESVALKVTKLELEPLPSHLNRKVIQESAGGKKLQEGDNAT